MSERKRTTISYKVHKIIYNPEEKQQIIPNMQEPIISEEQWLRVQEIRKNRIRPTATGRTSLFKEIQAMMEEMKNNPKTLKLVS